jgi:hypothetical protein
MMLERFTDTARHVLVQAQDNARGLGHGYIGCEHLLLAAAAASEPAGAVLRDQGVTPDRIKAEILRTAGPGQAAGPAHGLDAQALASIGIDLDVVRARVEAAFGPDALSRALPAARRRPQPALGKGPLARLTRRRRRHPARRHVPLPAGPFRPRPLLPGLFPAAISRSRRARRRPWRCPCARRRRCTTTTSASSTSPWPCSGRTTARYRRSCQPSAHRPPRCAPPSWPATARRANRRLPARHCPRAL